jgi:hypothetical protein
MNADVDYPVDVCPTQQVNAELGIRLLALVVEENGDEAYRVSFRKSPTGPFVAGVLMHEQGEVWALRDDREDREDGATRVVWTSPDAVFALALGHEPTAGSSSVRASVTDAAPYWPAPITERLASRGLSGPGTLAFDAGWFLTELTTSTLDHPILLSDGASKLGLKGLQQAADILDAVPLVAAAAGGLAGLLGRAVHALAWSGDGRLIAEFDGAELAQLGTDIADGCQVALGTGPLPVVFAPLEPLGLGLGPLVHAAPSGPSAKFIHTNSVGAGCIVGEVDPGGAAERAGVRPGMALSQLSGPSLRLPTRGPDALSFEAVLDAIDTRRSTGRPLTITFETAAPVSHLYAVEMPAAAALDAIAATVNGAPRSQSPDIGVGASLDVLCSRSLVWREDTPRLFLGEAGSVTAAHTDMCPQLQMAHALSGTKLLGVASHRATPRLRDEHAADAESQDNAGDNDNFEHEATSIPTDRPLTERESQLLGDPEMTIAVLRVGDLAVFDSGALHFASNGAEGICAAIYHGSITHAAVPRLRLAAAAHVALRAQTGNAYDDHLFAPELLRLVERRLAAASRADD